MNVKVELTFLNCTHWRKKKS